MNQVNYFMAFEIPTPLVILGFPGSNGLDERWPRSSNVLRPLFPNGPFVRAHALPHPLPARGPRGRQRLRSSPGNAEHQHPGVR